MTYCGCSELRERSSDDLRKNRSKERPGFFFFARPSVYERVGQVSKFVYVNSKGIAAKPALVRGLSLMACANSKRSRAHACDDHQGDELRFAYYMMRAVHAAEVHSDTRERMEI